MGARDILYREKGYGQKTKKNMFSVLFFRKIGRRGPFLFFIFISKWPLKMAARYIFPDSRGNFFFKMAADNFFFFLNQK